MALSEVAARELARLRVIRFEAARNAAPLAWRGLDRAMRRLLVTLAGVEGDVNDMAGRDWREYSDADKSAIGSSARYMAKQVGNAGALLW